MGSIKQLRNFAHCPKKGMKIKTEYLMPGDERYGNRVYDVEPCHYWLGGTFYSGSIRYCQVRPNTDALKGCSGIAVIRMNSGSNSPRRPYCGYIADLESDVLEE